MEENNNHFFNLKHSIELENAFQKRQRMESRLRIGNVPAHIVHPIAAAMMGRVRRGDYMNVDAGVDDMMGVSDKEPYNHAHREFSKHHRKKLYKNNAGTILDPLMADFTDAERRLGQITSTSTAIDPAVLRSFNAKVRARNSAFTASIAPRAEAKARAKDADRDNYISIK